MALSAATGSLLVKVSQKMQGEDLYCTLFVSGATDADVLTAAVDSISPGAVMPGDGPGHSALDIAVHAQVRHLPLDDDQDDFVLWRQYLDVDAASADTGFDVFLAELVRLITGLRARRLRVVAACDFEEVLAAEVSTATS